MIKSKPVSQALLFSDPKPLVKRLGKKFFQHLPKRPGVYLMRDAQQNILYVGKAKNLKQRLNSYRIANPDRLGNRHLRLLRQVERIEFKLCRDETSALAKEAELIRSVRPKFNRAGVWPTKPKCLLWRVSGTSLKLKIGDGAEVEWQCVGPLKGVRWLRMNLARLIWLATYPNQGVSGLPAGWHEGKLEEEVQIRCEAMVGELASALQSLSQTGSQPLINLVRRQTNLRLTTFEAAWVEAELETLADFHFERIGQTTATTQTKDEQRLFAFA